MSKSTQNGASSVATTGTRRASQSTNGGKSSISAISATTAKAKSQQDSLAIPNFQDTPNAVRLIQALAGKLGKLVFWRKVELGDGQEVYALCFPVGKWEVNPVSEELGLR